MNDALPERLPAGTGLVPELDPEVVVQTLTVANPEPEKKPEKTYKNEKDLHRKALDYYFLLGAERSLEKVATQFKVKKSLVLHWSASFDWVERVRKLETRSKRKLFLDRQERILMLQQHGMTRIDENGVEVLTKSGESPERTKTIQQAWDLVAEARRKGDPEASESGAGPDGDKPTGRFKGGTMVNVIIKK